MGVSLSFSYLESLDQYRKGSPKNMSAKILLLSFGFIAVLGLVKSAKIECYVGSAVMGTAFDTKAECADGITKCQNATTTTAGVTGTALTCAASNDLESKCTETTANSITSTTCVCDGTLCNKFDPNSGAFGISPPALLLLTIVISAFAYAF